jgi:hypothetical protein
MQQARGKSPPLILDFFVENHEKAAAFQQPQIKFINR